MPFGNGTSSWIKAAAVRRAFQPRDRVRADQANPGTDGATTWKAEPVEILSPVPQKAGEGRLLDALVPADSRG